jgi:hypothetical protein
LRIMSVRSRAHRMRGRMGISGAIFARCYWEKGFVDPGVSAIALTPAMTSTLNFFASALYLRRSASTARSGPLPSTSVVSIRLFAGRPLKGG